MIDWLKRLHRRNGPVVSLIAALALLLACTLILAAVFALFAMLMLIDPYLALGAGLASAGYLIWKKV